MDVLTFDVTNLTVDDEMQPSNADDVTTMTYNTSLLGNVTLPPDRPSRDLTIPEYIVVSVTLFYSIIFALGVIGNMMVILVVCRHKTMRSPTNVFLVNLTIADLSVILVCMPPALLEFYSDEIWLLGDVMCEYNLPVSFFTSVCMVFSLVSMR